MSVGRGRGACEIFKFVRGKDQLIHSQTQTVGERVSPVAAVVEGREGKDGWPCQYLPPPQVDGRTVE